MLSVEVQKAVLELNGNLHLLPAGDRGFAESLIGQANRKGRLSPKQEPWVFKLLERATTAKPAEPEGVAIGDLSAINELFDHARAHLKQPSVVLMFDGWLIRLKPTGKSSRYPGAIHIASAEGDYEDRVYFGRISPEGTFIESNRREGDHDMDALLELLRAFAADPAGMASKHGQMTGKCCFCNTGLTDERSTEVGYGPVCAKNWNMPWGHSH